MKKCLLVLTAVLMLFFGRAGSTAGALEDGRIEKEDRLNLGKEKYYTAKEFFYIERDAAKAEELLAEAEEVFRRVEEDYDRYYWLGRVAFLKAGVKISRAEKEEAEEAFIECEEAIKRALACDREASDAHRLLGEALFEQNREDPFLAWAYLPQAFLLLEKAAVLDRENQAAKSALAEYYIEAPFLLGGNPKKGIEVLENISSPADRHEEFSAAYRLGKAYALDGRKEEAAAFFAQALSIYDKDPQVREELAKLQEKEEKKDFRAGIYPILPPLEGFVLGGGFFVDYKGFSPYLCGSYDLLEQLFYYSLATQLTFSPTVTADAGYSRKSAFYHPGYVYQEGMGAGLYYHDGLQSFLQIDVFNGEIGGDDKAPVTTGSVSAAAAKPLYYDWGKSVGFYLMLTAGRVAEENYYIANMELPVRYNDYRGLIALGYIDQGERTGLHYSNLVRGYESDDKEGSCVVLLRLERCFPLFLYSEKPFLGALHGAIFVDTGSLFNDRTDFLLQKSAGTGLVLDIPPAEMRLDLAVREDWRIQPVFALEFKMF